MNREIKFRVYDTIEKKYLKTPDYFIHICPDGLFEAQPILYGMKHFSGLRDRFILEQFTGLLDKNGVEIYEGDIVRDGDGDTARVIFTTEDVASCGCCYCQFSGSGFVAEKLNEDNSMTDRLQLTYSDIEIIGNIHQNEKGEIK